MVAASPHATLSPSLYVATSTVNAATQQRGIATSPTPRSHENPLGLPRNNQRIPPTMPRRGSGVPAPRAIPNVKRVVCVSSGKGGVGKSTVASNLAVAFAQLSSLPPRRVGLLDLDIFGPSVPKLMGLEGMGEPELTPSGALVPMKSHGVSCMSMGFLLGNSGSQEEREDKVVAWRGMMVMKATQQLLFDVDWRLDPSAPVQQPASGSGTSDNDGLDVLVIDMPPGTGDVALSLSQLVKVDGGVVVTTPQEIALLDAKKGMAMFRKTSVPISGLVVNMSHFVSPDTGRSFAIFGSLDRVEAYAVKERLDILARIPVQPLLSAAGDAGAPLTLRERITIDEMTNVGIPNLVRATFLDLAQNIWNKVA
ncbi:P-loop containing nucleoside triphosphate hydrolase protein [Testicularia cyperi]|uniref:P-loop containing nucleoside triphosphate hydrolase protein n=1 Tax=Testicularia cyperi TaxID=1882483 RepID=A0A317XIH5_9BASI|nr:P-loop containing nucleoside triphosphate hydrolase protein [Testicularia cyperi]